MKGTSKAVGVAVAAVLVAFSANAAGVQAKGKTTVVNYGWKDAAGYNSRWAAPYGPGEGAQAFRNNEVTVSAAPFTTTADFSVYDHLKYIRTSSEQFAVPTAGSLEFSADIEADTPGTVAGRVVHGCYGPPSSYTVNCPNSWQQTVREGQQAGVVLNMINFQTGQLFDWFVSGGQVFALIERLPTAVTGSPGTPIEKAYTQIIKEAPVSGRKHSVSIRYTRGPGQSTVEYFLDEKLFTRVNNVGIPLDQQGVPFTGYAPSLGPGEVLNLDSFVIGHGLFSLLDAFPYQDFTRPLLSVSIPLSERLFGQGAIGTWKKFQVITKSD